VPNAQTQKNLSIAYKVETTFNTPPAVVTGATAFRPNAGTGLELSRATINPGEIRADGKSPMGRLGSKSVAGSYPADLSVGSFDPLIEAVMRSTWVPAVTIAAASITSAKFTANTIVLTSGDAIALGVRVGDIIRVPTSVTATNNNRNLRVTAVATTTITVAETLTVNATADTTVTLQIAKKISQGATPVRRSFTFEEYYKDIDQSVQATGCRISSMKITGNPDGTALVEFGIVGADLIPLATSASPFYTSPTVFGSIALVFADATIRLNGADVATPTAFELTLDMQAKGQPGLYMVTPDVFEGNSVLTGSVSLIRSDLSNLTEFTSETEFELHLLLVEPESEPKDFISIFVPRIKLTKVSGNYGGDGAYVEALPFITGTKGAGVSGYDDSMLTILTSAA